MGAHADVAGTGRHGAFPSERLDAALGLTCYLGTPAHLWFQAREPCLPLPNFGSAFLALCLPGCAESPQRAFASLFAVAAAWVVMLPCVRARMHEHVRALICMLAKEWGGIRSRC